MNTYLAVMATIIVITQIIRIAQTEIRSDRIRKDVQWTMNQVIKWVKSSDDFLTMWEVFRLLKRKLDDEFKYADSLPFEEDEDN